MTADIVQAVREEIRACALVSEPMPAIPPPHDHDAERQVCGSVVSAEVSPADLGDLLPEHFWGGLHRWVYGRCLRCAETGLTPSAGLLIAWARDEGLCADRLDPEIRAMQWEPWVHPARLRAMAQRIIDTSHARDLIDQIQTVQWALRTGVRTPEQARRYLATLGG